jgi:hypothetical protein
MAIDIKLFAQKLLLPSLRHHPEICTEELFTSTKYLTRNSVSLSAFQQEYFAVEAEGFNWSQKELAC